MTKGSGADHPRASLSLDLDNQWSYMKIHGDPGWERYPSYLGNVVPRVLEILSGLHLSITVFVVGKDAELVENRETLRLISSAGHEIGNHSYSHESWMQSKSLHEIESEFDMAERAIESATGNHPVGFRGPGFCLSTDILRILCRRSYKYDASTLPSFIGPLARAYYFMKSSLSKQELAQRRNLFGSYREGLRPLKPYYWDIDGARMLELPVTTFPMFRLPFHMSYIVYLSAYSPRVARGYWRSALLACRRSGVGPSILLHPLDFIGGDEIRSLAFFPGMDMSTEKKTDIVRSCLLDLVSEFQVMPLGLFAESLKTNGDLMSVTPLFADQTKQAEVER